MSVITIDLNEGLKDELATILGAAFKRQEQLLMDFSNETKAALAALTAAQEANTAGLKVLTDRILGQGPVLTDDGKAQIAALQAQLDTTAAALATAQSDLAAASEREQAVAAAITTSAQAFSGSLNDALALVQPQSAAPVVEPAPENTAAPAAQEPIPPVEEAPAVPEGTPPVDDPASPPVEQVTESPADAGAQPAEAVADGSAPVNPDAGETIEVPPAPTATTSVQVDNAFMAATPSNPTVGPAQPFGE